MPVFDTKTQIFDAEMAQTKPKYHLIEHGRYLIQRKVSFEFRALIGRKKWHAPFSGELDYKTWNSSLKIVVPECTNIDYLHSTPEPARKPNKNYQMAG